MKEIIVGVGNDEFWMDVGTGIGVPRASLRGVYVMHILRPCLVTFTDSPHQGGVSVGNIGRTLEMDFR